MPGAVPKSLTTTSAPLGNRACTRFRAGIVRFRLAEHLGDLVERRLVEDEIHAGEAGQGLAGQVVLRRAETAGGDHEIGPLRGDVERLEVRVGVVGDGRVPADGDADLGEPQAEPLAVGVEILAGRDLGADR